MNSAATLVWCFLEYLHTATLRVCSSLMEKSWTQENDFPGSIYLRPSLIPEELLQALKYPRPVSTQVDTSFLNCWSKMGIQAGEDITLPALYRRDLAVLCEPTFRGWKRQRETRCTSFHLESAQIWRWVLSKAQCLLQVYTYRYPLGVKFDSTCLKELEILLDHLPPWTSWEEEFYFPGCPALTSFATVVSSQLTKSSKKTAAEETNTTPANVSFH